LKFGSEACVLKKREEQRLEAALMKFLRRLLGITKLDKENNQCVREKRGVQNIVKEIKQRMRCYSAADFRLRPLCHWDRQLN
jgi:K+-sensing histidine kinase KdpD